MSHHLQYLSSPDWNQTSTHPTLVAQSLNHRTVREAAQNVYFT